MYRTAFARADAVALIVFSCLAAIVLGGLGAGVQPEGPLGKARATAQQLKEASQIRGIINGLTIWAQNNRGEYPLPSKLDTDDDTVAEKGLAKNSSAAIYSVLIFNGFMPVELVVSPAETNPSIKPDKDYETSLPQAAVDPRRCLWDPAFSVDFVNGEGNASFANAQPGAARRDRWRLTESANDAVIALRGPWIADAFVGVGEVIARPANEKSMTFAMHGEEDSWSGNVGFNDAHVDTYENLFGDAPMPARYFTTYDGDRGAGRPDIWFYDEPDDWRLANQFLGIFPKAGREPADFAPIWD